MWTWLHIFLPELTEALNRPQRSGSRDGLDWYQVMDNQRLAVLRRGGVVNLAATFSFALFWMIVCYVLYQQAGAAWLLLPANLSLIFALALFRRYRLVADTPTSSLSSGAQGYAVLQGKAALPDGVAARGLSHLPVTVWLPGYVEDEPFLLEDGKGRCLLYPQHAEIVTFPGQTHFSWLKAIYPGQTLYALGELRTWRTDDVRLSRRERVLTVLAEWKRDQRRLKQAFDANGNGRIDPDEWREVVRAAGQWVDQDIREEQRAPSTHVMDGAAAGQLFLITNVEPERLAMRYRWAGFLHAGVWLGLMVFVSMGS